MLKGIRCLTGLVLVVYSVSMIAGPAFGWQGIDGNIKYDIHIDRFLDYESYKTLTTDSSYKLALLAWNNDVPIKELTLVLPPNFELKYSDVDKALITGEKGRLNFGIRTPKQAGKSIFVFRGKDIKGNNVEFTVPMTVASEEGSESFNKPTSDLLFIAGVVIVVLAAFAWTGIFRK